MMVVKPKGLCHKEWWCVRIDGHEGVCEQWLTRGAARQDKREEGREP